ncbi:hypothetical protein AAD018_014605 [Aestuariibius insulae]|uniref:hypothetical protein n=1 Tax=Aestuariibius insulae TaxID=2058287 RepID=UPI00345E91C2
MMYFRGAGVALAAVLAPLTAIAELTLVQGANNSARLEGRIDGYAMSVNCSANWGHQGLAGFMIGPRDEDPDPALTGVSGFGFEFILPDNVPEEIAEGAAVWSDVEIEEFNDRLFWYVPIDDTLTKLFAYSTALEVAFTSRTGPVNLTMAMDRPDGDLVGRTGQAWLGLHQICQDKR